MPMTLKELRHVPTPAEVKAARARGRARRAKKARLLGNDVMQARAKEEQAIDEIGSLIEGAAGEVASIFSCRLSLLAIISRNITLRTL